MKREDDGVVATLEERDVSQRTEVFRRGRVPSKALAAPVTKAPWLPLGVACAAMCFHFVGAYAVVTRHGQQHSGAIDFLAGWFATLVKNVVGASMRETPLAALLNVLFVICAAITVVQLRRHIADRRSRQPAAAVTAAACAAISAGDTHQMMSR